MANGLEQGSLMLAPRANKLDVVPPEYIQKCTRLMQAINLCINLSGIDDKEIALALGIDAGHWSNIRKCKPGVHFPTDSLDDLMTLCGNEAPLDWQAWKRGKGLVLLKSEAERRAEEAERALELEREKNRVLMEAIQGRK